MVKFRIKLEFVILSLLTLGFLSHGLPREEKEKPPVADTHISEIDSASTIANSGSSSDVLINWPSKLQEHNYDIDYGEEGLEPPKVLEKKSYRQDLITQRDMIKEKSDDPFWKKWFAELLAAVILLGLVIAFICWYRSTNRGTHVDRGLKSGIGMTVRNLQFVEAQAALHSATVPEMQTALYSSNFVAAPPMNLKPLKCPKPACVCSGPKNRTIKGRRRWQQAEENESYAPA